MELYTLDSTLRRAAVIDQFESMIWTERYSAWGDFELRIISTPDTRRLLPAGTRLAMSDSYRVMTVELIDDSEDKDGRKVLKLSGRSIESVMEDRTARNTFANLTTTPKWVLTGKPGDIARQIFNEVCRTNVNFPDDQIPFLTTGSLFPPGNIAEPDAEITIELSLATVYKAVKDLCDAYDLGFRLIRNFDQSQIYFDIYTGSDRTTMQSSIAAVVFAPNLDNLTNIRSVTSISNYKNVAYVFHPYGVQIVTADGVSVEVEGFDRRVLTIDASNIQLPKRDYVVTAAQQNAVNAAMAATPDNQDVKNQLQKLTQRTRLLPDDITSITLIYQVGPGLTSQQRTDLQAALNYSVNYATTFEDPWLMGMLVQRGQDELAKNRQVQAFDGEMPIDSPYIYEVDYQLGDLVEMRNNDGVTNQMRVTEQIFVSDAQGERTYPTLTINQFIAPDTWLGWNYNQVWETADGYWATS